MTTEKNTNLEKEVEPLEKLVERPLDELAVFIGGDKDVFDTLVSEVNRLDISDEEKNEKLSNLYKAAKESGLNFPTVDQMSKVSDKIF